MNYKLVLTWNGTKVLEAECTLVCGCDVARAHFADQFAGPDFKAWLAEQEWLSRMDGLPCGGHRAWQWSDETGSAFAKLQRVA